MLVGLLGPYIFKSKVTKFNKMSKNKKEKEQRFFGPGLGVREAPSSFQPPRLQILICAGGGESDIKQ